MVATGMVFTVVLTVMVVTGILDTLVTDMVAIHGDIQAMVEFMHLSRRKQASPCLTRPQIGWFHLTLKDLLLLLKFLLTNHMDTDGDTLVIITPQYMYQR